LRIIANYPLPISTCRARAGEPVGLLLYPSLESKSYLINPSPGFIAERRGPTYRPASLASGSLRRRRGSLVLGKPRRKLRISSRATIFKYPRTSKFESPAAPPTSNFKFPATLGVRSLKFSSYATISHAISHAISPSRELRSPASRTTNPEPPSCNFNSNFKLPTIQPRDYESRAAER
jgi:hypothetical protein